MAKLTSDTIASIKKYMRANEWKTKRNICNNVGVDMMALQQFFNLGNAKGRAGAGGVKEWLLIDIDRQSNGPAVEAYKPLNSLPVRANSLDFKNIKSRGIG